MKTLSPRITYLSCFLMIVALLGITFYLQQYDDFDPCPLCILQRITMGLLGVIFFLGAITHLKKFGNILIGGFSSLFALLGIILAGRQVWLQHLPQDLHTDCGASLQYLMQLLPWNEVIKKVFQGTAECSQLNWQFLYLSMAEWSLLWFAFFLVIALVQLRRQIFNGHH